MNVLSKKPLIILTALILIGIIALFTVRKSAAPDVTFITIEGNKIAMADLKGKVVLVNFWATDCLACVQEMPDLVSLYKKYQPKGLEIIAVAMPDDPPAQVLSYVTQKKIPFPVMHDGLSEISTQFGNVDVTPTTFIFNMQGKQLQRTIGKLDFIKLDQLLNTELSVKIKVK